jgi:hypothetical protein
MRKLVLLLSVVAVSYGLQAGDGTCSKDKAACDKSKVAASDKAKAGSCDKATVKGSCPAAKKAEEAAKKPAPTPKQPS